MPDKETYTDLHFPKAGVDIVHAFSQQPNRPVGVYQEYARTTPVGINCRSYDAGLNRVRGGSRSGLSRKDFLLHQVNDATFVVQDLRMNISVGVPFLTGGNIAYYTLDTTLNDSSPAHQHLAVRFAPVYGTGEFNQALYSGAGHIKPLANLTDAAISISAWFYAVDATGDGGGTGHGEGVEVGDALRMVYRGSAGVGGRIVVRNRSGANIVAMPGFTLTLDKWHLAQMVYDGTDVKLYVNRTLIGSAVYPVTAGWSALTFGIAVDGANFSSPVDEVGVWNRAITAAEADQLWNSGRGIQLYDKEGKVSNLSQSGRNATLVAVSQGIVKVANPGDAAWTATTNNTGETPPLNYSGVMMSASNQQKLYFADGINYVYYDPSDNSVNLWVASKGTLPVDSDLNAPRLICTWRGRTVLSGLLADPQNWFMSRVGDPTDFDYSPTQPSPAQAVAGNNSALGLVGDVMTALIPFSDDVLVMGMDHSIYMMRGDPAAGGQIDRVSNEIGIAFGEAWCQDPYGNIYFISNKCGVYTLVPGQQPVRISQAIETELNTINMGQNIFRMQWNDRFQGFHLFVTWVDEPKATRHYFWEQRTGAWWFDEFANENHNPLCCVTFDGNSPDDRLMLIGCWDGYVRVVDPAAVDDDGYAIASEVWIGPLLTQNFDEINVKDVQAVLGETSGVVEYSICSGATAEAALVADPIVIGSLDAGRNLTDYVRQSDHAHFIRLTSSVPWSMEAIRVRLATLGKIRRRGY